jgi:Flp pilus assembly protein TadB
MSDSLSKPIHASSTQLTTKLVVENLQPTLTTPNFYSKNEDLSQKVGQSIKPNIHTKNPSLSFDLEKAQASLKKARQHSPGIAGNIGHSFAVVGLVFIVVGLLLLLIGGLIIDTLGALALAFGFVFLLVWLDLAILQGLFDVIL